MGSTVESAFNATQIGIFPHSKLKVNISKSSLQTLPNIWYFRFCGFGPAQLKKRRQYQSWIMCPILPCWN